MEQKLALCPFCGGQPEITRPLGGLHNWQMQCQSCHSCGPVTHEETPDKCVLHWNTRYAPIILTLEQVQRLIETGTWPEKMARDYLAANVQVERP